MFVNSIYNTMVNINSIKLPTTWWSKVPKPYKRNTIIGDLHRSKRTAMNFRDKVKHSKEKLLKANCLLCFVDGSIRKFQSTMDAEDLFIISPSLFDEGKPFTLMDIPF